MLGELIGEAVFRAALALGEALWTRAQRPGGRDRDDARWRSARSFLARHAASVAETEAELSARMGTARGGAAVMVLRSTERVRISCAWDGDDVSLPQTDPRSSALPALFAPLGRVGGIESIVSRGRRIDVEGGLALAAELDHATRVIADITSRGRRLREALDRAGLDRSSSSVEVSSEGAFVVRQRSVSTDAPLSFVVARDGSPAHFGPRRPPASVLTALGPGPLRVEVAGGVARVCWPEVPDEDRIARADRALALLGAGRSPYR